jgi:hypothetical protein
MQEMRRIGVALAVWIVAVLLLWLGGGLGLRPSVVVSVVFALIFDQVIEVEKHLSEPKGGVFHLGFDVDLGSILLDLGIIDHSTDWEQIVALQESPHSDFPHFRAACVWIPEANLLVWPCIQAYQSKLELNVTIRLPSKCPLAESIHRDLVSRYDDCDLAASREERSREVEFFIEDGYPDFEFGLYVPKEFAEERIRAGGFGNACVEYEEKEIYGQFRLVIGRFPAVLFRPRIPEHESFRLFVKHLDALRKFDKTLKERFEQLGWQVEEGDGLRTWRYDTPMAKHKYMEIEIFNRER